MHDRQPAPASTPPLPDLVLYGRPGCHLCDDARALIDLLLAERRARGRPTPAVVERDITTNPAWERAFLTTIPVIELDGHRVDLATSAARIRGLLERLDATP